MDSSARTAQSNPFWDFIADLQQQGNDHPFFTAMRPAQPEGSDDTTRGDPWAGHWATGPFGPGPFGGRRGGPHHRGRHGPPPPPPADGTPTPPPAGGADESDGDANGQRPPPPPAGDHKDQGPPPPPFSEHPDHHERHEGPGRHAHRGGPGPHGPPPPFGGHRGGPGPHHEHGPRSGSHSPPPHSAGEGRGPHGRHPHQRGPCGPRGASHGRGGPGFHRGGLPRGPFGRHSHGHGHGPGPHGPRNNGFPFDLQSLAEQFQNQLFGNTNINNTNNARDPVFAAATDDESGSFTPRIDVFDTTSAYIVHASLPGVKKSDVSITWNAERAALCVSGVLHRPDEVDEEMLAGLALDERQVGVFEREVKLGAAGQPASIDSDAITAKLEDGVLRIEVPKIEEEWTEVKKVEIE